MFKALFRRAENTVIDAAAAHSLIDERGLFRLAALRTPANRDRNLAAIMKLCSNAYLGNHRSQCRVLGRFEMMVDTRDQTLAPHLLARGCWEIHVTECLAKAVSHGMTVVDVGANYGYYSLLMAGLSGPSGKLISIEANPMLGELLDITLRRNGMKSRMSLHRVAVSNRDGASTTMRYSNLSAMNGRIFEEQTPTTRNENDRVVSVPVRTLDSLIEPGARVDVMKVDIEGGERAMWQGATRVIADNPDITIVMEVETSRYADAETFYQEIVDAGFKLRKLHNDGSIRDTSIDKLLRLKGAGHSMLVLQRR